MLKRFLIILSLVLLSLSTIKAASLVNTAIVKKGVVNPLEEFIGSVSFSKNAKLASQSSGAVIAINFEAGDRVKKGDILVKIDSEILNAKIESAKALYQVSKINLENASKDFTRYKGLIAKQSISQKSFDDSYFKLTRAKQTLNSSKASWNELKIQKKKKVIFAPFDGVVIEKNTEISQWLNMGNTIATVVDTKNIDFTFDLPTSYIYKLDKNRDYKISLANQIIDSKLYAFIAKGDKLTRTFPVKFKAKVENEFLYDGMEATIKLPRSKKIESLIVPRDAVIKRFAKNVIFVVDEKSKALMIDVKIIGYEKESIAVFGKNLSAGMSVVIKGNERVAPNATVKIINK